MPYVILIIDMVLWQCLSLDNKSLTINGRKSNIEAKEFLQLWFQRKRYEYEEEDLLSSYLECAPHIMDYTCYAILALIYGTI